MLDVGCSREERLKRVEVKTASICYLFLFTSGGMNLETILWMSTTLCV